MTASGPNLKSLFVTKHLEIQYGDNVKIVYLYIILYSKCWVPSDDYKFGP